MDTPFYEPLSKDFRNPDKRNPYLSHNLSECLNAA